MKSVIAGSLIFLIILVTILAGCSSSSNNETPTVDFTFTTLDGQTKSLHDYYGKVIVLDLMGVNCQPCALQMTQLKQIQTNYSENKVTIISIDVWVSQGENAALLQQYLEMYQQQVGIILNWTFGLDDTKGTIAHAYARNGVPALYILDTKGNIYYTHLGYDPYATLASKLDAVLTKT